MSRAREMADLASSATTIATQSEGYVYRDTLYIVSNSNFTKATYPWLRAIKVICQGGGGGGGTDYCSANEAAASSGGGSGAYAESFITDISSLASSVSIVVGAGGTGGSGGTSVSPSGSHGTDGGQTSFGLGESYEVVASGGDRGLQGFETGSAYGSNGSTVSGGPNVGDIYQQGSSSEPSISFGSTAIGGAYLVGTASAGASSRLGMGGNPAIIRVNPGADGTFNGGNAGTGYGGGGGGSGAASHSVEANGGTGGNGRGGIVILELYS